MKALKKFSLIVFVFVILLMLFSCTGEDPSPSAIVTLSKKNILFKNIDEFETIEATVASYDGSDYSITWTSSDESVATCVDGLITAVGWGTCVIRAEVSDTVFNSCMVTVSDPSPIINLSTTEIFFDDIGNSYDINATNAQGYDIDKLLFWSSSNTSIATIRDGKINAVGYGTCLITASSKANGNSATCVITVRDPSNPTVEIDKIAPNKIIELSSVGDKITLTASTAPTHEEITWMSSNPSIATCEGGVVTAVSKGDCVIIAMTPKGTTSARMVRVEGGYDRVPDKNMDAIVSFSVENIGITVKYIDKYTDELVAMFIVTGVSFVSGEYPGISNAVTVRPSFTVVKVFDKDGYEGTNSFSAIVRLYRENGELCSKYYPRFKDMKVGDTLTVEIDEFGVLGAEEVRLFYFVITPIVEV